jgi:RNA polymerase sigma-70 factor, ECF subfamily
MGPSSPQPRTAWHPTLVLLYREHFERVVSAVRFCGVPEADSADVAQDVFVRAHASFDRYDPARPARPWLMVIAYRAAVDYRRSAHARRMRPAPPEDFVEVVDMAPSPEKRTLLSEAQRVFTAVVAELTEEQRTVYLMNVADEIPISEIAAALGQKENTVRSRLHRAHEAFNAALAARRTAEERRNPALAPLLLPAGLADAARKGFEVDPATKALVWSRLSRLLGMGIVGALAPLSGPAIPSRRRRARRRT